MKDMFHIKIRDGLKYM